MNGEERVMECRSACGACCVAPSISSAIPGMPEGKPAGVRCVQLTDDDRCLLFGRPERPAVCVSLRPSEEMCGRSTADAFAHLTFLERATSAAERTPQDLSESKGSGLIAPPAV